MDSDTEFDSTVSDILKHGIAHVERHGMLDPLIVMVGSGGKAHVAAVKRQADMADPLFAHAVLSLLRTQDAHMCVFMTQVAISAQGRTDRGVNALLLRACDRYGRQRTLLAPFYLGSEGFVFLDHRPADIDLSLLPEAFRDPFTDLRKQADAGASAPGSRHDPPDSSCP